MFVLIAQLIFIRSLRKATFPFLFIWNLVFKISFGTLSHKHLRNVARGSRSVARAPHIVCVQCVLDSISVSCTHNSLNYHRLNVVCVVCVGCVGIFKLFETFFKNTVLFFKTNFNLNLPCTPNTHHSIPCGIWLSAISNPAHMPTHTLHTHPVSNTHDREPRFANHLSRSMTHELANRVQYYLADGFSRNDVKNV